MDGRGDVDDTEDGRRNTRYVIFIFTLRTHYAYVEVYELSTVQIRETHFRFRFHFKRLKIANPKIRKSENPKIPSDAIQASFMTTAD